MIKNIEINLEKLYLGNERYYNLLFLNPNVYFRVLLKRKLFRLGVLVKSFASFIKLIISFIIDFFPPKGGFLFLFTYRFTLI